LKSLMLFLQQVLIDLGTWCGTSTHMDYKTIHMRVEGEGFSFLTITLPSFGKDFQKSLDRGYVDHDLFLGFKFTGSLPRLFGGFFDLIFDRDSGRLLDSPNKDAIFAIRQISLMFSKILEDCTDVRVNKALLGYIECEASVREYDSIRTPEQYSDFRRISTLAFGDMFSRVDRQVYDGDITPKHGPGSTAERILGNKKYLQSEWVSRLEEYFPAGEYLFPNWRHYDADLFTYVEPGAERPVRVITVPKTLKTPRIIAIEPVAMQYVQQGILEAFEKAIDEHDISSNLISWKSQLPNQQLAYKGSLDGSLATLDLSEASDRVSNQLVREMFKNFPHLASGVDSCRSRKADVRGHGVQRLAKFASMGSALCFPVESMVFMTIVLLGVERELNRPITKRDIKSLFGQVRTYGDDIIVPVRFVRSVINELEAFGLKVNVDKSYWTGKFRESCGKDFYDGYDVSVVKVRRRIPTERRHVSEIVSTVSLRNLLFKRGFDRAVAHLDGILGKIIPFPVVEETSPILGKLAHYGFTPERTHPTLHYPLVKGMVVKAEIPDDHLDDQFALLKFFLKRGESPVFDERHLERAGRPRSVRIMTRWARPY